MIDPDAGARPQETAAGHGTLAYGLLLLAVGAVFLVASTDVRRAGATSPRNPGPRAFPTALSIALIVAGAATIAGGLAARRPWVAIEGDSLLRPLGALAGLLLCTAAMPWAGFAISAFVFALVVLRAWGASWPAAGAAALALVVAVQLLFVQVFHVVMPRGPLNF